MGTRYFLSGNCPRCKRFYDEVFYAPTCGIVEWRCPCGYPIDLEVASGITYEEASNWVEIVEAIGKVGNEQHPSDQS